MTCGPTTGGNQNEDGSVIDAAVAGDQAALERLLLAHYDELERRIRSRLPSRLQSIQAIEDILQLTFMHAFRDIGRFKQRTDATLADWLARIADHRLIDAIREVKDRVTYCSVCSNTTDIDPCVYCSSETRNHKLICVVEEPQNVTAIEFLNRASVVNSVM